MSHYYLTQYNGNTIRGGSPISRGITQRALVAAGTVSLSFGLIGLFVPVWPTTPFLLLSSYCYLRGSPRMHRWLSGHPVFGRYIQNYMVRGGITRRDRLVATSLLWSALIGSICLSSSMHLRLLLIAVGIGVSIHLSRLKTLD